ncbi:MAG: hypothetical protein ACI8UO_002923 [Verrucomicrobiales bacterium]|jgi:hypothetical protein
MRIVICFLLTLTAVSAQLPADHAEKMKAGLELFQKTIRPALEEHCLRCHGGEKTRAAFDLTSREALLKGGDTGAAIDLEKPELSFLLAVLRHDEEPFMPAKKPKLDQQLLTTFAKWVELGAPYDKPLIEKNADDEPAAMVVTDADREFWSFKPLAEVDAKGIDELWAAKLKEKELTPSEQADPRTLVRRAYLDLIGLPPTPQQINAALAIPFADLVDELLASPHHGERWARHWLDAARFAESHGFEQDYDRKFAFHYRDFVIKALNSDMPYDQFTRWQLAGDEIAPEDPLAMMATGFLGAGVFPTQLTEKEFESARYDELDDMAATMGTAMLGLTVGCARCHDHKFDPIPVRDYYRLVATFSTTIRSEIDLDLDPDGYQKSLAAWEGEHAKVVKAKAAYEKSEPVLNAFETWLKNDALKARQTGAWAILEFSEAKSDQVATSLTAQPDGSFLASGKTPAREIYTFKTSVSTKQIRHFRIEALTHDSMPRKGPGRAGNGNFALSNLEVLADGKPTKIASVKATHEQNKANLSAASAFDDNPSGTGWAVDVGGIGKDQASVYAFAEPVDAKQLEFRLTFANNGQHSMGRPRISISSQAEPPVVVGEGQAASLTAAFAALESGKTQQKHRETLFPIFASKHRKWAELNADVGRSMGKKPAPNLAKVQVSSEGLPPTKHHADGRGFPHFYPETHFLSRGDANQKLGVAEQGFLQVLMRNDKSTADWQTPPPADWRTSYRRTSLANWITDTENGAGQLLARVIVNRVWHHHFGRGIVATPNDFGLQGTTPSNEQLLDFLATRLIENGWKLKPLHREIMLSAAYQQSSRSNADKAAADPANEFVWRFQPRRLEAEIIRDSMLAVSGRLDPTMFGAGTLSEAHARRSIYFMIKRSRLVPMMQIFDQPEPLVSQGGRPSTTIAPQALLFMNNPQVISWANSLAAEADSEDLDAAIADIYQRVLSREPTSSELVSNRAFLDTQIGSYEGGNARKQALADLCQIVFSLNEFVYLQ